ncbi:hypothetical protein ACTD5D_23770 [Nocardia takedensis]|uniref:hypothetical protein n=1 Tax=Nocardia takedensis TaxID=259390 RepID=UPI0002F62D98|nr:hypothetical protein [Nocardia takedensis]
MVDPVSLGVAAAAVLAAKYGEELAGRAADGSVAAVARLRELVLRRLGRGARPVAELERSPTEENRAAAAEAIDAAARTDPDFAAELHQVLALARREDSVATIIATVSGNAKQVTIARDNHGTINM